MKSDFSFVLGASVLGAGLFAGHAAAQCGIYYYQASKYISYTQTSNAQPAEPDSWGFFAAIYSDPPGSVLTASLSFDVPPPVSYEMYEANPTAHQYYSGLYADEGSLDADFPSTTYTFTADCGGGPLSADLFLPVGLYCEEIPHFTGDTYDRLQTYDPALAFDGDINGFIVPPGANIGVTNVSVSRDMVGQVFSIALDPGVTSFQVPAGLLQPSANHSISVSYASLLDTPNAGFGTATSSAAFSRGTAVTFTTLSASVPCTPSWMQANLVGRDYHVMAFDPNRGQVITFGGFDSGYRNDTWAWTGQAWQLAATTGPSERGFSAMVHHTGRNSVILAGGQGDFADTWEWNGSAWTRLSAAGFLSRGFHAMAYDSARDRIVMFGGAHYNGVDFDILGDTWEWDGATWTQVASTGPVARDSHAMAYDPVRQRVILFGGSEGNNQLDDTWEWDGADWTQVAAAGPSGRLFPTMAYDPVSQTTVLYAGNDGAQPNDVWHFDGAAWTQVLNLAPPARHGHGMAFDEARSRMIVFGGQNATATLSDTWERSGTTWADRTPAVPSRRSGGSMVYDSARDRTVMFGGSFSPNGMGSQCNSETWEWDGLQWLLRTTGGPSARALTPMVYDSLRGRTVMVGGWCGTSVRDTWEWNGSAWSLHSTTGPSLRHFAAIAFDAARGKTVYFGGYQPSPPQFKNDTWEWNGTTWTQAAVAGPPARYNAQMTYDAARQRVVLFGGNTESPSQIFGDTWEFNGAAWTRVSAGGLNDPSPRVGHTMAYDAARARVVLFGGISYSPTTYYGDTWEFDGVSWTQVESAGPTARASSGMAYDGLRDEMVLFGGSVQALPAPERNDTWLFTAGTFITEHPASRTVAAGQTARLHVTAVGRGTLTYRWRKGGVALTDGPTGSGSVVSGAATGTLTITNAQTSDAGDYDCEASTPCGEAASTAAQLSITPPVCVADVDDGSGTGTPDGGVTIDDLLYYLAIFDQGVVAADVDDGSGTGTRDGGVTIDDLLYYLARFDAGC